MRRVEPSSNQSATWSDEAFGATEFLFADYRDFVFPAHLHETFAIGVIEAGGQRFQPGRAPALVMPAGKLCAINPGVVHEGCGATEQGWRYRMFYPSPALVASKLEHPQRGPLSWRVGSRTPRDRRSGALPRVPDVARVIAARRNLAGTTDPHRGFSSAIVRASRQFLARAKPTAGCPAYRGTGSRLPSFHVPTRSQHRRLGAGGWRVRYARDSGLLGGNRHAAARLSRQPEGRTGKGVASRRTLSGRGGAADRLLRSKSAHSSLQAAHRNDAWTIRRASVNAAQVRNRPKPSFNPSGSCTQ